MGRYASQKLHVPYYYLEFLLYNACTTPKRSFECFCHYSVRCVGKWWKRSTINYGDELQLRGSFLASRACYYVDALSEVGAPLTNCVGMIDCTNIKISRPGGGSLSRRACYSGHKPMNSLNFQTMSTPDGLIFVLYGPEFGRRHDLTLLSKRALATGERQFYTYGDSAYTIRPWYMRPFICNTTGEQREFNRAMSSIIVAVEHNYKDLKHQWVIQNSPRNLKVRLSTIALL